MGLTVEPGSEEVRMCSEATREVFTQQLEQLNAQVRERGARHVDVDPDGAEVVWVDENVMGAEFMRLYQGMASLGYARR